jgi:hypothetical protein
MLSSGIRGINRGVTRALASLSGVAVVALSSGFAAAQDAPSAAPAEPEPAAPSAEPEQKIQLTKKKPMIDLATPPPSEPEGRTYHEHDGFSVRVNVGLGTLLSASAKTDGFPDAETSGLTLGYDLLIGGAPSPGFTIGGGISGSLQLSGDWEFAGTSVDSGNLNNFVIGPFAQGYPDSHGNLNFGGMVGLARLGADPGGASESLSAIGVGGAFWAGSGVWVAPDWSVGGLLRLDAATGKDDDVTVTAVGLSLMFSVTYN